LENVVEHAGKRVKELKTGVAIQNILQMFLQTNLQKILLNTTNPKNQENPEKLEKLKNPKYQQNSGFSPEAKSSPRTRRIR